MILNTCVLHWPEKDTVKLQAQFDDSEERINTLGKEMEKAKENITLQADNLKNLSGKISITGKHILFFFIKNDYETLSVIIPLQTQFGGILVSGCPSVFSPLSHDFVYSCSKKWVHVFLLKNSTLVTYHLMMCTWNFDID